MKFLSLIFALLCLSCLYIFSGNLFSGVAVSIFRADAILGRSYDMATQASQYWLMQVIWISASIASGIAAWRYWNKQA